MGVSGHITHGFLLSQSICKVSTESHLGVPCPFCAKESGIAQMVLLFHYRVYPLWETDHKGYPQSKQAVFHLVDHLSTALAAHTRPANCRKGSRGGRDTENPFLFSRTLHGLSAGYGICASFGDEASSFRIPVVMFRYRQLWFGFCLLWFLCHRSWFPFAIPGAARRFPKNLICLARG